MSLKTWTKNYYPVEANKVKTMKEAIRHTYRKWYGVHANILSQHGLRNDLGTLKDNTGCLAFGHDNCALCVISKYNMYGCEKCPLKQIRNASCIHVGYVPTTTDKLCMNDAPFQAWSEKDDNSVMMFWLTRLAELFKVDVSDII